MPKLIDILNEKSIETLKRIALILYPGNNELNEVTNERLPGQRKTNEGQSTA